MAFLCTRGKNCQGCFHFRYDEDRGEKACWGRWDMENIDAFNELMEPLEVILDYDDFIVTHRVNC